MLLMREGWEPMREDYLYKSRVRKFISSDEGNTKAISRYVELESTGYGDATLYLGDTYLCSASIWPGLAKDYKRTVKALDEAITDAKGILYFIDDYINEMEAVKELIKDEDIRAGWETDVVDGELVDKDDIVSDAPTVSEG